MRYPPGHWDISKEKTSTQHELFKKYDKMTKSEPVSGAKGFSGLLIFWIAISGFIALGSLSFKGKKLKKNIRKKLAVKENQEIDKTLGKVRKLN